MDRNFKDFAAKQCEMELLKNSDYKEMQKQSLDAIRKNDIERYSECNILMQDIIQQICYIKGLKDMEMLLR